MSAPPPISLDQLSRLRHVKTIVDGLEEDFLARLGAMTAVESNPAILSSVYIPTAHGQAMFVDLRDYVGRELYLYGAHEMEVGALLVRTLKPGDAFIDVGAHFGYFSQLAAGLVGPHGRILAVEPTPASQAYLKINLRATGVVEVIERPAWKSEEEVVLRDYGLWSGQLNSLVELDWSGTGGPPPPVVRTHKLTAVTLDSLIQPRRFAPALIKIDVEGAEPQVLQGLRETLKTQRPVVIFEASGPGRDDLIAWWGEAGYEVCGIAPDGELLQALENGVGVNLAARARPRPDAKPRQGPKGKTAGPAGPVSVKADS